MTLDEQFRKACEPDRWKILGRKLVTLTRGHVELLEQMELDAGDLSPVELLVAIRVCSMPRKKASQYLARGGWSLRDLWALLVMRVRPIVFHTAVELFSGYLAESRKLPNFWSDSKMARTSSCPETLMMFRDLPRYTEDEILDMPYAKAHWIRFGEMEKAGALDFIEDDVIERAKAMAKQVAEEEAAANGHS